MKNILLDLDSITYFLHTKRNWEKEAYEKILQQGIRSLENQKIIGITKNSKRAELLLRKMHLSHLTLWEECSQKSMTIPTILQNFHLSKEETVVVSASTYYFMQAKLLHMTTVYWETFGNHPVETMNKIEKLEELKELEQEHPKKEIASIYIDSKLLSLLENISQTKISDNLLDFANTNPTIAYTMNPYQGFKFQRRNVKVCFVNTHTNDWLDVNYEDEIRIEDFQKYVFKQLKK